MELAPLTQWRRFVYDLERRMKKRTRALTAREEFKVHIYVLKRHHVLKRQSGRREPMSSPCYCKVGQWQNMFHKRLEQTLKTGGMRAFRRNSRSRCSHEGEDWKPKWIHQRSPSAAIWHNRAFFQQHDAALVPTDGKARSRANRPVASAATTCNVKQH